MINQMSLKHKRKNIKNFTARNLNKIKLVTTIYMAQSYAANYCFTRTVAAVTIIGPTKTKKHKLCTIILLGELQAQEWIYNFDENIIII